jgi:hypothetical protein
MIKRLAFISLAVLLTTNGWSAGKKLSLTFIRVSRQRRLAYVDSRDATGLKEIDLELLAAIERNDASDVEPELAELVYEIVVANEFIDADVMIRGFDILENSFKNKSYYCNQAEMTVRQYGRTQPFVVKRVLEGMTRIYVDNPEIVSHSFRIIYSPIKSNYLVQDVYGYREVVPALMDFCIIYLDRSMRPNVKDDPSLNQTVMDLVMSLGLSGDTKSRYDTIDQSKRLREIYNSLKK